MYTSMRYRYTYINNGKYKSEYVFMLSPYDFVFPLVDMRHGKELITLLNFPNNLNTHDFDFQSKCIS